MATLSLPFISQLGPAQSVAAASESLQGPHGPGLGQAFRTLTATVGDGQGGLACCKKIRDTKGTFHAKMGSIKDRNGLDLTEAEFIKKRWQEYTEEL